MLQVDRAENQEEKGERCWSLSTIVLFFLLLCSHKIGNAISHVCMWLSQVSPRAQLPLSKGKLGSDVLLCAYNEDKGDGGEDFGSAVLVETGQKKEAFFFFFSNKTDSGRWNSLCIETSISYAVTGTFFL